jgi:hypothetical protein
MLGYGMTRTKSKFDKFVKKTIGNVQLDDVGLSDRNDRTGWRVSHGRISLGNAKAPADNMDDQRKARTP